MTASKFDGRLFQLSAGRLAAFLFGISIPLAFWSATSLLSSRGSEAQASQSPSRLTQTMSGSIVPSAQSKSWDDLPSASAEQGPEFRLLAIYRLIGQGDRKQALEQARALTTDVPNFQLAQLVYGDLLSAHLSTIHQLGDVPSGLATNGASRLAQLRQEAEKRLAALQDRPPADTIPDQFIDLPRNTKYAIAVDTSRSRLYLFENSPQGMRLVSDHYASIGKLGPGKHVQGDQRTPIGVYYITSHLTDNQLTDLYGIGALPLNYPNEFDKKQGRTGHGIWLHGVPSSNYARSPMSTDGCVALANPELAEIISKVETGLTPVVIAKQLTWQSPQKIAEERNRFQTIIQQWQSAKSSGNINQLMAFYDPSFSANNQNLKQWRTKLSTELSGKTAGGITIKDMSILGWQDGKDLRVVTFGEIESGQRVGVVKRQYWVKQKNQWKIFFEGVIA